MTKYHQQNYVMFFGLRDLFIDMYTRWRTTTDIGRKNREGDPGYVLKLLSFVIGTPLYVLP